MPTGIGFIDKLLTGKDGKGLVSQLGDTVAKFVKTPEDRLAAQAELDKVLEEHRQFALELYKSDAADTDSARKMGIAMQGDKPGWLAKNLTSLLAIFVTATWIVITLFMFGIVDKIGIPKSSDLSGTYTLVTSMFVTVLGYYFGSSHSSAQKQATIDRLTKE